MGSQFEAGAVKRRQEFNDLITVVSSLDESPSEPQTLARLGGGMGMGGCGKLSSCCSEA